MCGESGRGRSGKDYHYYKCVSVKKKRTDCKKKAVKKDWIEDLVIKHTVEMVNDDKVIEAIVAMLMDLQERENIDLPLYEQQLRDVERNIENLLNAIQQGILTKSTKARMEELEAAKEELEIRITNERMAKPKLTEEQLLHFLHKFRVLDMSRQSHRQRLIDTFVNRIYLYDDKLVITFNHKDGAETITLNDIEAALAEAENGSDLVSFAVPKKQIPIRVSAFLFPGKGLEYLNAGVRWTPARRRSRRRRHHNITSPFRCTHQKRIRVNSVDEKQKVRYSSQKTDCHAPRNDTENRHTVL